LQHRGGDKGLGDARGANVGVRCEACAGVDVGVPGGVLGDQRAVADDGDPAGEVVVRDNAGDGLVEGVRLGGCRSGCQADSEQDGPDDCAAH
jgi:hypothetical protein